MLFFLNDNRKKTRPEETAHKLFIQMASVGEIKLFPFNKLNFRSSFSSHSPAVPSLPVCTFYCMSYSAYWFILMFWSYSMSYWFNNINRDYNLFSSLGIFSLNGAACARVPLAWHCRSSDICNFAPVVMCGAGSSPQGIFGTAYLNRHIGIGTVGQRRAWAIDNIGKGIV